MRQKAGLPSLTGEGGTQEKLMNIWRIFDEEGDGRQRQNALEDRREEETSGELRGKSRKLLGENQTPTNERTNPPSFAFGADGLIKGRCTNHEPPHCRLADTHAET